MTEAKATTLELYFVSNGVTPYIIGEPREYKCDGKDGYVRFNGHFYVEDGPPSQMIWRRMPQVASCHYAIIVVIQSISL